MAKTRHSIYIGGITSELLEQVKIDSPSLFFQRLVEIAIKNGTIQEAFATQLDAKELKNAMLIVKNLKKLYGIDVVNHDLERGKISHQDTTVDEVQVVQQKVEPQEKKFAALDNNKGLAGFVIPGIKQS